MATQTLLQAARERLGAQVKIREDGHMLDKDLPCPIQARFIRCAPEHDHQTKNQCMLCNTFVKGGFPMKVMHLMGNSGKDSTSGCGYTGQTRPRCKFFCKVQHREMQQDLQLVGGAHKGESQIKKSWANIEHRIELGRLMLQWPLSWSWPTGRKLRLKSSVSKLFLIVRGLCFKTRDSELRWS